MCAVWNNRRCSICDAENWTPTTLSKGKNNAILEFRIASRLEKGTRLCTPLDKSRPFIYWLIQGAFRDAITCWYQITTDMPRICDVNISIFVVYGRIVICLIGTTTITERGAIALSIHGFQCFELFKTKTPLFNVCLGYAHNCVTVS